MSEIRKLIERLCPDGVEYKKLGEVCEIKTGKGITQKDCTEDGEYPVMSGGQTPMGMYSEYNREGNTVTVSRVGAYAGFVIYNTDRFYCNDKCFSVIPKTNIQIKSKYLFYVLKHQEEYIKSLQSEGGVPTINTKKVGNVEIPVPPIEVQSKIVEILDNFTELEAKLEAELEAELEGRRKQYEYYRNQLLTFDEDSNVKYMKLGDLAELVTKQTGFDYTKTIRPSLLRIQEEDSIPYMQTKNFSGRVFDYNTDYYVPRKIVEQFPRIVLNKKCLLFSIVGASIGNVGLFPGTKECFLGGAICVIKFKDGVNIAYIYEIMSSWYGQQIIRKKTKGLGQATVTVEDIRNFVIPIPSPSEQQRIVSILDRFEALTTDLQSGLPAEIEARRKQYEYYREQLLTFKNIRL